MRLFENKLIVGGICILIAALLSFLVLPGVYKNMGNTIVICKLKSDISAGTKIGKESVREVETGAFGLPGNVIKKPDEIVGKYAKANIAADDLLFPSKFADYVSDARLDKLISEGKKLVSVSVANNAASVANHLKAGDVVTLACYIDNTVQIFDELRDIEIYSIENAGSVDVDKAGAGEKADTIAATLTLVVDEKQAQKLVCAEYSGKIHAIFEKRGAGG